jgi:hypothetical protein
MTTDTALALLPCPFCGKPAVEDEIGGNYRVGCFNCQIIFRAKYVPHSNQAAWEHDMQMARKFWNRRAPAERRY